MRGMLLMLVTLCCCDPPMMPPTSDGADQSDLALLPDMSGDRDFAHVTRDLMSTDIAIGLHCFQALGDGSVDALPPGAPCSLNGKDHCAVPEACTFDSFQYDAACLPGAPVDGGSDYRCCQFAKTHNMVSGEVEQCRDCGDGMRCGPI